MESHARTKAERDLGRRSAVNALAYSRSRVVARVADGAATDGCVTHGDCSARKGHARRARDRAAAADERLEAAVIAHGDFVAVAATLAAAGAVTKFAFVGRLASRDPASTQVFDDALALHAVGNEVLRSALPRLQRRARCARDWSGSS